MNLELQEFQSWWALNSYMTWIHAEETGPYSILKSFKPSQKIIMQGACLGIVPEYREWL